MAFWNKSNKIPTKKLRKRNFLGSLDSRLTADWHATNQSPDLELNFSVTKLRARSRELARNDGYAKRYMELLKTYVVGSEGIQLQPILRLPDGSLDVAQNAAIKVAWEAWSPWADLSGRQAFQELAVSVIETVAKDGEVFVHKVIDPELHFGCAIRLIDADFLDVDMSNKKMRNGNHVIQGIEMDDNRKVIAYHFFTRHPQDTLTPAREAGRRTRIEAKDIIHIYRQDRPNQTRGIPWMSSILYSLRMLSEAKRYELIAARTAAGKMGFIEKSSEAAPDELDDLDSDTELDQPQRRILPGGPGEIGELEFGETFKSWDPQHPNSAFESFTRLELQTIASGLGVSYQSLSSDLSGTSYSSGRLGSVLERDMFRSLQMWFARVFYNEVYNSWIEAALLSNQLKLKTRIPADYQGWDKIKWQPRGFIWIDPKKDLEAYERGIALGLASRTDILNSLGLDLTEVFTNLAAENALADELEIDIDGVMSDPDEEVEPTDNE